MTVWIVGKYYKSRRGPFATRRVWEFMGVFETEAEAVAACRAAWYFVAPATLGETLPEHMITWPGCYYPFYRSADQVEPSEHKGG